MSFFLQAWHGIKLSILSLIYKSCKLLEVLDNSAFILLCFNLTRNIVMASCSFLV